MTMIIRTWLFASGLLYLSLTITPHAKADLDGIFTYQNGTFTTLNNIPSLFQLGEGFDGAGIDNAGEFLLQSGDTAFLYSSGTITPINVPGFVTTLGINISANGTILGRAVENTSIYFTDLNGSITPPY